MDRRELSERLSMDRRELSERLSMDRRSGNYYTLVFYSTKLSYSASQKPSLLCQKDRAARFYPKTGTEPYVEFILNLRTKSLALT
ncbi:hypothetical protein C4Q31_14470 [Leptospira borgpetersenii serovar Ceylonica]|nr:hypothetical protein C4Q31_14470 [Leptospira borgpetersenii serovar Ceylonica]